MLVDSAKIGMSVRTIARKIYFLSPSVSFHNNYDLQLEMYEEICRYLTLPLSSIRVVGSAHTGFSLVKGTVFDPSVSDLDIAVVDAHLFLNMFEFAFELTNGWKDIAKFSNDSNARAARTDFLRYLSKGIIRPDLMPSSPEKAKWSNFFGKLGDKYSSFCCGISVGVYARESFMAAKQETAIKKFLANEVTI